MNEKYMPNIAKTRARVLAAHDTTNLRPREIDALVEEEIDREQARWEAQHKTSAASRALMPNKHGVRVGDVVLYRRDEVESVFPAIVTGLRGGDDVTLCAFSPAPEAVWGVEHCADGSKPRSWRAMSEVQR